MDAELYQIMTQRNAFGDLRPMAEALARKHMEEMLAEKEQGARFDANAQRRMQQRALSDPALVRARSALEAPVQPFEPKAPSSYAPGAASDVGDLRGAFGPSTFRGDPGSRVDVGLGDVSLEPRVDVSLGDLTLGPSMEGAFSAPQTAPERVQETVVRGERNRKPLPRRPTYQGDLEGGITGPRIPEMRGEAQRADLSPEGAAMYEKLAPSLVNRRNNEETTRRTLEAEQMRGDTSKRNAQLRSATDLLRTSMQLAAKAEQFRLNRKNAKSKDEALKWADQERDARLQAMNAKMSIVEKYQTMFTDENDPEFMTAKRDAHEAMQLYRQAEDDFNALRTQKGMDPKGKGLKKSGTQSFSLDANGNLVPG